MVKFATNVNFLLAKLLILPYLFHELLFSLCKICNFVTNGNFPSAEWLTFPKTAIFSLPRLLYGIWLFSVCARKYICVCVSICVFVGVCYALVWQAVLQWRCCCLAGTSSPGKNRLALALKHLPLEKTHTHKHTCKLTLCIWHSMRRLRRCHAPCLPAL